MKQLSKYAHVSEESVQANFEKILPYIKELNEIAKDKDYIEHESLINLPLDENLLRLVKNTLKEIETDNLKYIIAIGIGGSNLGTRAVYDAIFGYFDILEPARFPKIIFLDTNDTAYIIKLQKLLKETSQEEVLINIVSESGKTIETLANLEFVLESIPSARNRIVFTTNEGSQLWETAKEQKVGNLLPIPDMIGGRFSIFSPVGLFPLLAAGVDIVKLMEGAMETRQSGLSQSIEKNFPALSAIYTYENYKKGKTISTSFFFHPEMESLGKWYRQVMSESLGKEGKGITPMVSIGSSDLHSVGQLYIGGPKDKFFTLINTSPQKDVEMDNTMEVLIPDIPLPGKSANDIMDAIYEATKEAFVRESIPFLEIELTNTGEMGIGAFMQFKMMEVMFLGKLMGVNTFDQPNVEGYKTKTREILSGE